MHEKPRIAWIWPESGLIDGDVIKLGEQRGAEVFVFRIGTELTAGDPGTPDKTPEEMESNLLLLGDPDRLAGVAAHARAVQADVVVWACTSGSFVGNPDKLSRQVGAMEAAAGAPATTTSVAVLHALRTRGITRVCVITPYPDLVGDQFVAYLERHGVKVLAHENLGRTTDEGISALTVEDFMPVSRRVWREGAQGWVLPCTAVRLIGLIEWFEQEYGVPTIAANAASLDHAIERARERTAVAV